MPANQVIPFQYQSFNIRATEIDGQPWFVAMDVAESLGYADAWSMTRRLDDDEIRDLQDGGFKIHIMSEESGSHGGTRRMTLINESGLYSAILGSIKPEAKVFKKWVTSEVLPMIRRTGGYLTTRAEVSTTPELVEPTVARKEFVKLCRDFVEDGLDVTGAISASVMVTMVSTGHDFTGRLESATRRGAALAWAGAGVNPDELLTKGQRLTLQTQVALTARVGNTMGFTIENWLCNRMDLISIERLPAYRLMEAINVLKTRAEYDRPCHVCGAGRGYLGAAEALADGQVQP